MALKVMLVDDEALARMRLRDLLADCADPATELVAEAANAQQALELFPQGIYGFGGVQQAVDFRGQNLADHG